MADFETLNFPNDCRVWAWACTSLSNIEKMQIGTHISGFIDFVNQFRKKSSVYFHNLKFDGEFVINYLLHQGYEAVRDRNELHYRSFTTTISDQGQFYAITILNDNGTQVSLLDSLKKLPFKVKEIAKAFQLDMMKGSIDYDAFRSIEHVLTPEEIEYIKDDIRIVAESLVIQLDEGMTSMTVSKDCLQDYIETIGGETKFRNLFPVISREMYYSMKPAYGGGWTYVKESIAGKVVGKGMTFDYNSMYPAVMDEELLPIGYPVYFQGEYKPNKYYPLFIQKLACTFELKPDHLPTIQVKNDTRFKATEYLTSSRGEIVTLYLSNIDLQLFFDHYDVDLADCVFLEGYMFQAKQGMFENYITKHMYTKAHSKGALRLLAKLKLNGLYGKFGSELNVTGKTPYLKKDGSTGYRLKDKVSYVDDQGRTKWKTDPQLTEYNEGVYLPVAIFVTSYARNKIIRAAQKVYGRFCYADTDSIHITGWDVPESLDGHIHETKLGYLKKESMFVQAKFLRAKTYMEKICVKYELDEQGNKLKDRYGDYIHSEVDYGEHNALEWNVKCAGMDEQAKKHVTLDNFYIGSYIELPEEDKKLRPRHVKGGISFDKIDVNIRENIFSRSR